MKLSVAAIIFAALYMQASAAPATSDAPQVSHCREHPGALQFF